LILANQKVLYSANLENMAFCLILSLDIFCLHHSSGLFETFELKKKIFSSFLSKNPHDFSALKNSMKNIDKNEL